MKGCIIKISFPFLILFGVYFLGPVPTPPQWDHSMPSVPPEADQLEAYIQKQEQKHKLKPDNNAHIVWFDERKTKTEYSLVYLHGFSASHKEGNPTHIALAKKMGCNLYLSRLADHGIDTTEHLLYLTVDRLWSSAKQALAIGKAIGDKVIIISTSTGGSLALILASTYPDKIHALINMSPNIQLRNPTTFILNKPWGLQIARLVVGGLYVNAEQDSEQDKYWYRTYRLEGLVQIQELLNDKMTKKTFKKVYQPSLTLYYYRDKQNQDPVVKVSAMLKMHEELSTPDSLKAAIPIPYADTHVIGSGIIFADVGQVEQEIFRFAEEKLHMIPVH